MDNRNVNPEVIRLALSQQFPRWGQAFDCYRRHKPYGGQPKILMVNVAISSGALICKRPMCRTTTQIRVGERVSECCPLCGHWETSWITMPGMERVPVKGVRGGATDSYTARDFCIDLERWCEAVTFSAFGCRDGWFILELWGIYNAGRKKSAEILTRFGHPISDAKVQRIRDHFPPAWEGKRFIGGTPGPPGTCT